MKAFLLILALALSQIVSSQVPGGWTPVDPDTVDSDPEIQQALTFGARHVVQQGVGAGDLPDADYEVTGIYSVQSQVVSGINYQFDVELTNDEGLVVRANYVVYIQSWTNTEEVTSSNYEIVEAGEEQEGELQDLEFLPEEVYFAEEEGNWEWEELPVEDDEPIVGGWEPVSLEDAASDLQLQNALTFGIQQATAQAIQNSQLPDQGYQQDQLISVEQQVVSGINYRFNVNVRGDDGRIANLALEVYSQVWTDTLELTSSTVNSLV